MQQAAARFHVMHRRHASKISAVCRIRDGGLHPVHLFPPEEV